MGSAKKTRRPASLKSGRPPTAPKPKGTISSRATQKTIVTFHQLNKDLQRAKARRDESVITSLQSQLSQLGGLKAYQEASIQGQAVDRGGDSSSVLLQWLESSPKSPFRLLEIGALSNKNACSRSPRFKEITRIDLNSQVSGILQQDFMQRPLPTGDSAKDGRFDILSLSLVLNFVPDAQGRGAMLRRTVEFLAPPEGLLFLVLPASCLLNSRYFNEERLTLIMAHLGYVVVQRKQTAKLIYHLWQLRDKPWPESERHFKKVLLTDGRDMNNFSVVLEPKK